MKLELKAISMARMTANFKVNLAAKRNPQVATIFKSVRKPFADHLLIIVLL